MRPLISALVIIVAAGWVDGSAPRAQSQVVTMGYMTTGITVPGAPAFQTTVSTTRPAGLPGLPAGYTVKSFTNASTHLTINAVFDSTLTSDGNAAAIENTINQAIAVYAATFSDPITVTIIFEKMASGLGQSTTYFNTLGYSTFLPALKADATTSDDATANSLLPASSTTPVTGGSSISAKLATFRAIGFSGANFTPPGTDPDGWIDINFSQTSPGSPGTSAQYSLLQVVEHEIDEVLGLGSALVSGSAPTTIMVEDLFRYTAAGARSYTASTATAYFSINASTLLAQFNNAPNGGDYGDWQSNPLPSGVSPQVQDAFGTPGASPTLGNNELTALDVCGFNRVAAGAAFTDPTLTVGTTLIKAVHITELRTRINAQRSRFGLAAFVFTDPTLTAGSTTIKAVHVTELRTALQQAYAAGGFGTPTFTDPTLDSTTAIKAIHITELRNAVISLEGR